MTTRILICKLTTVSIMLCTQAGAQKGPAMSNNGSSTKLWGTKKAPSAYLGVDIKTRAIMAGPDRDSKFVISGKRPAKPEGLSSTDAGNLTPVEIQVGTKRNKPVMLEVYTLPSHAEDVAALLQNHERWTELIEQLKDSLTDVKLQECAPPSEVKCARFGRDNNGKLLCKEYRCEVKAN